MPGPLFDCYVLSPSRSSAAASNFLDRFMPKRRPLFAPTDPFDVLGVEEDTPTTGVFDLLEANRTIPYTMYWAPDGGDGPPFALLSFTADGYLVLGLSPCAEDRPTEARSTLAAMLDAAGARLGYLAVEDPPPASYAEFLQKAETYRSTV